MTSRAEEVARRSFRSSRDISALTLREQNQYASLALQALFQGAEDVDLINEIRAFLSAYEVICSLTENDERENKGNISIDTLEAKSLAQQLRNHFPKNNHTQQGAQPSP